VDIFGFSQSTRALVAAAIAFIPAIVAYVRGRQIARFADDPALPERLFAGRHKTSGVLAIAIATLLMIAGPAAIWAIPLTAIAYCAAGLPLRRILYDETWSLPVYLSFVIRFFIAGWSFWILVSALPAVALWSGERAWILALVMGAGLMLLADRQTEVIRRVIGATPLTDEAIRARFDRLVAAAGLATPHFEFVDLKGGSFANAFAVSSLRRSAVVFTGPLLQRLDADETDAICAHELAHLEYHNPKRLRRQRLVSRSLVAGGALLAPLLQQLIPSIASLACLVWPCVVLIALVILVHDRQKHETASDLRAVALTGNPEALVRALVKLHAIARVPRRWDADLERHMSHPSLKRRIQDIRAASGTAPATLGNMSVFESADGPGRVVFHDETLELIEGASASHRLRYDRLSELRIEARPTRETSLLAADRGGHRWQMPLRPEDVPRIQAVLDIVDARVETSAPAASIQPVLTHAVTFIVCIVSLNAGLIAVAMVVAMNFARPAPPLLCAAGLAAMAGAVLRWRDPGSMYGYLPGAYEMIFAAVLLAGGSLLVWLAHARRRDEVPVRAWKLVGVIALATVASWLVPIIGRGIDAVGLHQAAREWPSTVVLPLALAGAMMWSGRKALRIASAAAVFAGMTATGIGSQRFLERFGRDLFLVPTANFDVRTLNTPVSEFTVPFSISELQLSPGGRSIAAVARRRDNRTTIHIGRAGQTLTPIDVDGALFIDDDRALVWSVDGSRTDLREVLAAAPESATWQLRVTGVSTPAVSLDANSRRWRLASRAGVNVVEAREGVIGTEQINSYQWNVPTGRMTPFIPIALSGDRAIAIEPRPDLATPVSDPLGAFVFVLASAPRWRSTIWAVGPDGASDLGTSRLELQCHVLPLADRGGCHIFDASRTRFFAVDAETRGITTVASLPGRFYADHEQQSGWITGWHEAGPVAVRLSPADAIRVTDQLGARAHMLAVSDRAAAGVWHQMPATSGMRVDALYPETGTSIIRIYVID
jgi:Zn-dependent protease with chaperone function